MCEGWKRVPMLLSLERVVVGAGTNNLTTIIVNAVKNYGGLDDDDLVGRMASFGADKPVLLLLCFVFYVMFVAW